MSDMREELMNAAEQYIRSRGYDGFSFREIAAQVGIKSSSVHYYYPTKADLGAAVARRYSERFFTSLPTSSKDRSKALANAFVQAIRRDGQACLCGVLASVHGSLPTLVGVEAKRFFELAISYLLCGETQTVLKKKDREWAFQVVAQLEGGMMLALALGDTGAFVALTHSLPAQPA